MFSAANGKIKLPPQETAASSALRCLLHGGPFRDLHFSVSDNRLIPVHDVVFLDDDIDRNVKPLIYRPVHAESADWAAKSTLPAVVVAASHSATEDDYRRGINFPAQNLQLLIE
ncbi:uncharacterized protein LOC115633401 [Scaptodrosophila lebanonensis]|uniref:Uncharacterized protein LOC115633401 n=1 Tax=Drosophila lebanonensis TaxID=7225 RepID=A0A6J2UGZ9_DROLE|nr:uncharacterized protein LOC115633401 [Scaptodrosophila lebanonensis]